MDGIKFEAGNCYAGLGFILRTIASRTGGFSQKFLFMLNLVRVPALQKICCQSALSFALGELVNML